MRPIAYCGDHVALTYTYHGDKIYVDTRDTSLAPHLLLDGNWEDWVSRCFLQKLSENQGATVVDIGANVGWYTLLAAHFGAGMVFAFEPQLALAALLVKSVRVNGYGDRVRVLPYACGEARDILRLSMRPDEIGGARLLGPGTSTPPAEEAVTTTVPVVRLDHELPTAQAAKLIIKIDVEGHEPKVLLGAQRTLERRPILFIEHHRTVDARDMLSMLKELGYAIRHVRTTGQPSPELEIEQAMELGDAETLLCEAVE